MPLPSYPVLPAPRTWSPGDKILTRYLRGDVTNAVQLLTGPPLVVAAQLTTGQSLPQNVITQLGLDTDLTDTWAAHQIPSPQISAPLPGWYLCEGYHASNNAVTSSQTTAGLTYTQNGTAYNVGGASTSTEGSNGPAPAVADLVLLNGTVTPYPFTATSAGSLFTAPGSAYSNGTPVVLSSAGATLPGGFAAGVTYWVVSASGPAFQLSAASGGSPQAVTSTGSGTVTATDTVALYGVQTGASTPAITHAYLTMQWAGAPSGTVIASPVAPAPWPPGSGVTLTSPAAAGATSVVVSSAQGMIAGGTLGLDVVPPPGVSPPSAEPVTITAITGTTISITPCAYPHSSGAPVTVPVSAAWLNQQVRDQIRLLAFPPMARLTNSGAATQNLASQTFPAGTAVTWNQGPSPTGQAAWLDNYGGWSGSSPTRYVFPLPGVWYVYGQVSALGSASAYSLCAGLRISGGTTLWGDVIPGSSGGVGCCATVRRHLRVTAGQYAEVMGSQNLGSALQLHNSAGLLCKMIAIWRGF